MTFTVAFFFGIVYLSKSILAICSIVFKLGKIPVSTARRSVGRRRRENLPRFGLWKTLFGPGQKLERAIETIGSARLDRRARLDGLLDRLELILLIGRRESIEPIGKAPLRLFWMSG